MKTNKNILKFAEGNARKGKFFAVGNLGFKISKAGYFLAVVYNVLMIFTVMLGNIVLMLEYSEKSTTSMVNAYNEQRTYLITMIGLLAVIIVSVVLQKFRLSIPFAVTSAVNCVVAFTVFYGVSVENDIKNGGMGSFWGLFGVPSILLIVTALALAVIMFLDSLAVKREYDGITSRLYFISTENGTKNLSNEEFDTIMTAYDGKELFRTDIPLKKSLKHRKEKQGNDNGNNI
jgi:MFS superfamily sulfate permease-like transporter